MVKSSLDMFISAMFIKKTCSQKTETHRQIVILHLSDVYNIQKTSPSVPLPNTYEKNVYSQYRFAIHNQFLVLENSLAI